MPPSTTQDPAKGLETAKGLIDKGADVLYPAAGARGQQGRHRRVEPQARRRGGVRLLQGRREERPGLAAEGFDLKVDDTPKSLAWTEQRTLAVDRAQYEAGEGPCLEAAESRRVQRVAVAEAADRWPAFTEAASGLGMSKHNYGDLFHVVRRTKPLSGASWLLALAVFATLSRGLRVGQSANRSWNRAMNAETSPGDS